MTLTATRARWWLYAAAVASSLPALGYYLVGEEGILVNSSLEMAQRDEWRRLWLYGADAMHGVFANWLIILGCKLVGWTHAPAVSRAIMIAATAAGGGVVAGLAWRLYRRPALAAMAAVICVCFADVLFYRGWLGYRDPVLATLLAAAIASLWLAVRERRALWLLGTVAGASAAFLTKGLIAYAYVGAAVLVFLCRRDGRAVLLRPLPLMLALATFAVPWLWAQGLSGDQTYNARLGSEIGSKLALPGPLAYLEKLAIWPFETFARLLPVPLLLLWWRWREPRAKPGTLPEIQLGTQLRAQPRSAQMSGWFADVELRSAAAIVALGAVPFWLAPSSHIRYLLPLLPFLALLLAAWLAGLGEMRERTALQWLWALLALKLLAAAAFPLYQTQWRGANYAIAAHDIVARSAGQPLYTLDATSAGLAVTAYVNLDRLPQPALTFPPATWRDGLVIAPMADPQFGAPVQTYKLAGDTLYLLCRGAACTAATPPR